MWVFPDENLPGGISPKYQQISAEANGKMEIDQPWKFLTGKVFPRLSTMLGPKKKHELFMPLVMPLAMPLATILGSDQKMSTG